MWIVFVIKLVARTAERSTTLGHTSSQAEEVGAGTHQQLIVPHHGRRICLSEQFVARELDVLVSGLDDGGNASAVDKVDAAVGEHGTGGKVAADSLLPVQLSGRRCNT